MTELWPKQSAPQEAATAAPHARLVAGVLLVALFLLAAGQMHFDQRVVPAAQTKVLFAVALALAGAVLVQRKAQPFALAVAERVSQPQAAVRRRAGVLLLCSIMLALVAAAYAARSEPPADAPAVWLLSLTLSAAALMLWMRPLAAVRRPQWPVGRARMLRLLELLVLAAILTLGLWLRVVDLTAVTTYVNVDEGAGGLDARIVRDGRAHALFENGFPDIPRLSWVPAATFLRLPGDELASLRLSSALTSMLSLPLLYLLARMYVRRRTALLATFFLAVAVADINYARQGMHNIQNAPLTVATVYLLLRTVRSRSTLDAALCGAVGGLSLYSYFASRALPFVIGVVMLYMIVSDRAHWRSYLRLALVILLAALIVFAPQLGYYATHPQALAGHTVWHMWWRDAGDTATLWTRAVQQLDRALWGFTYYFDTSFHYGKDLRVTDTLTGLLFLVGFVVVLLRWRRPQYMTLLAWFVVMTFFVCFLTAGAPSSPRMCGLIPAVCLMAAIAAEAIWETIRSSGRRAGQLAFAGAFGIVPALVLAANYNMYFVRVENSYTNDPGTHVARYLQREGETVTAFMVGADVPPEWATIRFLAPKATAHALLAWEEYLPIRQPLRGDAAFIVGQAHAPAVSYLREYYPHGVWSEERSADGRLIMGVYRVAGADIAAQQGLTGTYVSAADERQTVSRKDREIAFDWTGDRPDGITGAFSARWDGSLYAPDYGVYVLRVEGGAAIDMALDGNDIISKASAAPMAEARLTLARGWHVLRLQSRDAEGTLRLLWTRPGAKIEQIGPQFFSTNTVIRGLRASYWAGGAVAGAPTIQTIEPGWFGRANAFTIKNGWQPYVAAWDGWLTTETAGPHLFAVTAFEGALDLKIDGQTVIMFASGVYETRQAQVDLSAGRHAIAITFNSPNGRTERLQMWWQPPGAPELVPVPPSALEPSPS